MDMSSQTQVTVEQGVLQGKTCVAYHGKRFHSFEGIPYAKPPLGKLRFRNPEDAEKWSGIRDATKPGNKCVQMNFSDLTVQGSEDCLYLNVYTPVLPCEKIKKLPVIFFVHGGSFLVGYGHWYRPDHFMRNDVVFVTINYRLNILGFLCLDLPEVPGNIGLKDSAKALHWVHKNIVNFNGDPNNITLFGESAGSAILSTFLCSKMTRGLFTKLIAQSGNCVADVMTSRDDYISKAIQIAKIAGSDAKNNKELYDFFIDLNVDDLVNSYFAMEFSRPPYVIRPYLTPIKEKKYDGIELFLDEQPIKYFLSDNYDKVPTLVGFSMYEGGLFLRKNGDEFIYENDFSFYIPDYLNLNKNDCKAVELMDTLKKVYFNGLNVDDSMRKEFVELISDVFFNRDLVLLPELLAKLQKDVYMYQFSYIGNLNIKTMKDLGIEGTTHGDIIQYEYYRENKMKKCDENDINMTNFLIETWCNFAKTGKPTWNNQKIEWKPYNRDTRLCLDINVEKKMIRNPKFDKYTIWPDLTKEKSKL